MVVKGLKPEKLRGLAIHFLVNTLYYQMKMKEIDSLKKFNEVCKIDKIQHMI